MIIWVSAANQRNIEDLRNLQRSAGLLAGGSQSFRLIEVDDPDWRHTIKFRILRAVLQRPNIGRVFWIDADCEFVAPVPEGELVDPARPLTAVRHFWYPTADEAWPDSFKQIVGGAPSLPIYWQSCVFGGTAEALRSALDAVSWMEERGVTYDEHMLNWYWSRNSHLVHTLPSRYAAPSSFHAWHPDFEKSYRERAGGDPVILHHNRATYPLKP